jgi:hypothetical protein
MIRKKNPNRASKTRFKLGPRYVTTPLKLSIAANIVILIIVIGAQPLIQPVVPLFHSLPPGSSQLVPKSFLFLLPAISLLINVIHIGAINFLKMSELVIKLYAWGDLILQIILLMTTLRNIFVVV